MSYTHERIGYRSPEQNGHIESFHGTLKREYVWPNDFESFPEVEETMAMAFDDYNHQTALCDRVCPTCRVCSRACRGGK